MAKKLNKKQRKLVAAYGRVDRDKKRAGRRLFRRACKLSGMDRREFAEALVDRDDEALLAVQAVASEDDDWTAHFQPPGEDRDWASFFEALTECLIKFAPLILV
jgi:hypothetical protein